MHLYELSMHLQSVPTHSLGLPGRKTSRSVYPPDLTMRSARRLLVVLAFAVGPTLPAVHAIAQDKSPSTVHVAGLVVDAQTDVPIRRARLTTGEGERRSTAFTDERGRFTVDAPAGGTLAITKAGYVHAAVKVGVELRIPMSRGAAIIGRVVDAVGMPLESATAVVSIVPSSPAQTVERRRMVMTDDLGEFRFGGLAEGVVRVGALRGVVDERPSRGMEDALVAVTAAGAQVRIRPGDVVNVGDVVVEAGLTTPDPPAQTIAGSGSVTGTVHDARGRPVRVAVDLERSGLHPFVSWSEPDGRFRFEHLPAGSYTAHLTRPGATTKQVDVRDGATFSGVDFVITGGAAISGTVVDEYGEPIEGAGIRVLRLRRVGDRLAAMTIAQARVSDDRGVYRIFGLNPGRYLVSAEDSPQDLRNPGRSSGTKGGYAPVFYPATTNVREAAPISLDRGDATDADIAFRREPTMRVTGTAFDSGGRPVFGAVLLSVSQRSGGIMLEPRFVPVGPDGTFAFENVPPGDYVLQATSPFGGVRPEPGKVFQLLGSEFGRQYVTITDADPPPVQLRTSPGATLHGRVRVDGGASPLPSSITVYPIPTDFDATLSIGQGPTGLTKRPDDFFDVTGVTGSRRFAMISVANGWYIKEARVRGVDALETPFDFGLTAREFDDVEIVVSSSGATVSGTVVNAAGRAPSNADVVLFSTDSSKWYQRSQSVSHEPVSPDGSFRIASLPPGSYYLVALSDTGDLIDSGDWQDPATLDVLRRGAMRVEVSEGETRNVTLRIAAN
jgi:hypothetical protein